jgi:anti-sigma B factor antagonist
LLLNLNKLTQDPTQDPTQEDRMQVEESREGSVLIIEPREPRLDAQRAVAFKEILVRHVEAGTRQLVLDLKHVEFMDSSGLGAVVAILKRLGFYGVLVVCGARDPVAGVFRLTRMDRVIRLVADRTEAVAAAQSVAAGNAEAVSAAG